MDIKTITTEELRRMRGSNGLVLQICSGNLSELADKINNEFTEKGILLDGTRFSDCYAFTQDKLTGLFFPFTDGVKINDGKLAVWQIRTFGTYGGAMLSDYVPIGWAGLLRRSRRRRNVIISCCPSFARSGRIPLLLVRESSQFPAACLLLC